MFFEFFFKSWKKLKLNWTPSFRTWTQTLAIEIGKAEIVIWTRQVGNQGNNETLSNEAQSNKKAQNSKRTIKYGATKEQQNIEWPKAIKHRTTLKQRAMKHETTKGNKTQNNNEAWSNNEAKSSERCNNERP